MKRHSSSSALRLACIVTLAASISPLAHSSPRLDSDSLKSRHDMLVLKDAGAIESAVLTWPWPLGRNPFEFDDNAASLPSAKRLQETYSQYSKLGLQTSETSLSIASDSLPFRSYGHQPREQFEAGISQKWLSEWFAGNLSLSYADNPSDGKDIRFDGSFLAVALGNWSLALDQVDRWWGPGWDGSLILSNNARPIPAVSLTRISPEQFESKWLKWIGPWTFTTFLGQLDNDEGDRPGSDARLFGMRIDFSPFGWKNLDIGLSRTAQWGGDGRPDGLGTFWKLFIGEDNKVAGSNVTDSNEPGNQLAGIDWRFRIPKQNIAYYVQITGEDEETYLPDANMLLSGIETWGELSVSGATWRAYFEWADTRTGYLNRTYRRNRAFNTAYNHGIYQSGYRRYGQAIGHAMDGDSVMRSVGAFLIQDNGNTWGAKIRNYSINRDGSNRWVPHSVSDDPLEGFSLEVFAELVALPFLATESERPSLYQHKILTGLHYIDEENQLSGSSTSDFGGFLSLSSSF